MYHPLLLLLGFWYIFPSYVANGFAVFSKFIKSRHSIDNGRLLRDGQPIFGPGKSWEGFFIGFISGVLFGIAQLLTAPFLLQIIEQYLVLPSELYPIVLLSSPLVLLIALGALIGDILGSFLKRRLKIPRGKPAPFIDQLDFLVVSLLFGAIVYPLPLVHILFLLVVTPLIHLLANVIGYLLRVKQVPW